MKDTDNQGYFTTIENAKAIEKQKMFLLKRFGKALKKLNQRFISSCTNKMTIKTQHQ